MRFTGPGLTGTGSVGTGPEAKVGAAGVTGGMSKGEEETGAAGGARSWSSWSSSSSKSSWLRVGAAGRDCCTKSAISLSTPAWLSIWASNMPPPGRSSPVQSGGGASTGVEGGSASPLMTRDR